MYNFTFYYLFFLFFIITIFYNFLLLFLFPVEVQHLATGQYIDSILLKVFHLLPISHQNSNEKEIIIMFFCNENTFNKAYRPNAHLLYIVMHYNGNII